MRLAQRLVEITPEGLEHVFLCDSGSVSVEVALKMCLQARPGRSRVLTVRGGYHGDTFGAMSVCDPVGGMHSMFTGALARQVFAPRPPRRLDDAYAADLEQLMTQHADELAAVIVEPVVQGAGGMWFYDPQVLRCCATCATGTACFWSSTRWPPGSGAPESCSRASTRA